MPKKKTVKPTQPEKVEVKEEVIQPLTEEQNIKKVMGSGLSTAYGLVLGTGATVATTRSQTSKMGDVDSLPEPKK